MTLTAADVELAQALEWGEAAVCAAFCRAAATIYPELPVNVMKFSGGGVALHYAPADPLNAAKGVGIGQAVSESEWDQTEEFFRAHGSPVLIDVCPFIDDTFLALLAARHYTIAGFETVNFQSLHHAPPPPDTRSPADGLKVELAQGPQFQVCANLMKEAFGLNVPSDSPPIFAVDFGRVLAQTPGSFSFLATVNGEPAGGANVTIAHATDTVRIAHMAGAAVLPRFRGRGIQRALTTARLALAAEHGCAFAKLDVKGGTPSHRNALRSGFTVAYTRAQMVRQWPA